MPAGAADQWAYDTIRAAALDAAGLQGLRSTVVAIVGTGIDCANPCFAGQLELVSQLYLRGNVVENYRVDDPLLDPQDGNGHGTKVASLVSGRLVPDGWRRSLGLAPGCQLLPVRVSSGVRSHAGQLALGLKVAAGLIDASGRELVQPDARTPRAQIILVTATHESDPGGVIVQTLQRILALGTIVVVAAGDDGRADGMSVPAGLPGVISVGALSADPAGGLRIAHYSNRSPRVDLYAPGDELRVAVPLAMDAARADHTVLASGTSFAAPLVAGALAALFPRLPVLCAQHNCLRPEVKAVLLARLAQRNSALTLAGTGPGHANGHPPLATMEIQP